MTMAVTSRGKASDLHRWKDRETSPERTKVWTEPPANNKLRTKVPLVYYLSRNGHLEQPHFMEVPISSPEGLYLRDVINRLNFLRGKGVASMYSWSSKRSYKNGFVWHDLAENDFIHPAHGQEYVLKGSELLDGALICKSDETVSSSSFRKPPTESRKAGGEDCDFQAAARRRNQSWSGIDFQEYKVYTGESAGRAAAADASTQTDDKRRRRRAIREIEEEEEGEEEKGKAPCQQQKQQSTELSRDEISPPPSDSSPETLESLMEAADGRPMQRAGGVSDDHRTEENHPSGRSFKASSVLMQLISCGSISFKDCSPGYVKGHDHHRRRQGFSLISQYKARLPRGEGSNQVEKETEEEGTVEISSFHHDRFKLEEKEYFSGSLIETKKIQFPALKRSNSYNADGSTHLELGEKEAKGVEQKAQQGSQRPREKKSLLMRRSAQAQR